MIRVSRAGFYFSLSAFILLSGFKCLLSFKHQVCASCFVFSNSQYFQIHSRLFSDMRVVTIDTFWRRRRGQPQLSFSTNKMRIVGNKHFSSDMMFIAFCLDSESPHQESFISSMDFFSVDLVLDLRGLFASDSNHGKLEPHIQQSVVSADTTTRNNKKSHSTLASAAQE